MTIYSSIAAANNAVAAFTANSNTHGARPVGTPPPPSSGAARPPPPGAGTTCGRPPPPSSGRDSFGGGVNTQQYGAFGAGPQVDPAFARQVSQSTTPQLRLLATQLEMEATMARAFGRPAAQGSAEQRLKYVQAQLARRENPTPPMTRFRYQREVGQMSNEQLVGARARESLNGLAARFRGDPAGIKESTARLAIIDQEISNREHELSEYGDQLGQMSPEQLGEEGTRVGEELGDVLGSADSTPAQRDDAFSRLSMLIEECLGRELRNAFTQMFQPTKSFGGSFNAMFSK